MLAAAAATRAARGAAARDPLPATATAYAVLAHMAADVAQNPNDTMESQTTGTPLPRLSS